MANPLGIPDFNNYGNPQQGLRPGELVKYVLQKHTTRRQPKRPHFDLRLGTQETGLYSWAIPKAEMPAPGEKKLAPQTQVHAYGYGDFTGTLPGKGYGAGTVAMADKGEALVTKVSPNSVQFTVAHSRIPTTYALIKIQTESGRDWLLLNKSKQTVPGVGDKPRYQMIDAADLDDALQKATKVQEKIDGAHGVYDIDAQGNLGVYSVNPRVTGEPIQHTERMGIHGIQLPKTLANTTLRGEMYGVDRSGKAIPFNQLGGLLNSNVADSLRKQRQSGVQMQNAIFALDRFRGKPTSGMPDAQRTALLKQVMSALPKEQFHEPKTEESLAGKKKLVEEIAAGRNPRTSEGVVLTIRGKPYKFKNRQELTAYLQGVYKGSGKREQTAGGLLASAAPDGQGNIRVGSGFDDKTLADIVKNLDAYKGRPLRLQHQGQFSSGLYRAPTFVGFEVDK